MLVGQAPISAYRTLDLPAVPELTSLDAADRSPPRRTRAPGRAGAAGDRDRGAPFRPDRKPQGPRAGPRGRDSRETIEDPALAGWLFGASWVADRGPGRETFSIWRAGPASRGPGWSLAMRSPTRPSSTTGRAIPATSWPSFDAARAAGGRIASTRGMDDLRSHRRPRLGDRVAACRPAVDSALDRPGRAGRA